jgi:hypothetical protein
MKKRLLIVFALATALTLQAGFTMAATATDNLALTTTVPTKSQESAQLPEQDQIYGVQLMTPQERAEFRSKMSAAKSIEERDQIRKANHQAMQERAESHGLTLPDQLPAGQRGMGHGGGMMNQDGSMRNRGGGMGNGGGMGSGLGPNQ